MNIANISATRSKCNNYVVLNYLFTFTYMNHVQITNSHFNINVAFILNYSSSGHSFHQLQRPYQVKRKLYDYISQHFPNMSLYINSDLILIVIESVC